uniref:Polyprotein protein n=1 Tax=Solanum tuberosum TaxID=4113 RepID=M1DDG0_SOLTU
MGHLAHLADTSIDDFIVRVTICERRQRESSEVTTLRVEVADFTTLFEASEMEDSPTTSEIPLTTIGDRQMDVAANESEVEIDEEQLGERDADVYDDLADLEDAMFETAC